MVMIKYESILKLNYLTLGKLLGVEVSLEDTTKKGSKGGKDKLK